MFSILPRDMFFFDLFENAADVVVSAAEMYKRMLSADSNQRECLDKIRGFEHEGDRIVHETLDRLEQTFITPFDREDIHELLHQTDDVIDAVDAAAKRMVLYQMTESTERFDRQRDVLCKAACTIRSAVRHLRNLKKTNGLRNLLREMNELEKEGDEIHHAAIADLFNHPTDPFRVMKWKEIYDITERAINNCEDVASAIGSIVLKNC